MFLIHAESRRDKVLLYFKIIESGRITQKVMDPDYYFLVRVKKGEKHDLEGYSYNTQELDQQLQYFKKVPCLPSEEDKLHNNYKQADLFDVKRDPCHNFIMSQGLQPYQLYDMDEGGCISISDDTYTPSEMTISIEVEKSEIGFGSVPRFSDWHIHVCKKSPMMLNTLELQSVHRIRCLFNGKLREFTTETSTEAEMIKSFLTWFKKCDPDVVQIFNWVKMHYLYQRCLWFHESKECVGLHIEFLFCVNRVSKSFKQEITADDLENFMFPFHTTKKKFGASITTRAWINYDDHSTTCWKFGFMNAVFGRIVLDYRQFSKTDTINATDLDALSEEIQKMKYLDLLIKSTGHSLYMQYYHFGSSLKMTMNVIKKYNPNIFFPYHLGKWLPPKVKILGGVIRNKKKAIYTGGNIFLIDYNSFYPSLITKFNLSPDVKSKNKGKEVNTGIDDHGKFTFSRFLTKEDRLGVIPNTIQHLISERNEIKEEIKMETDPDQIRSLMNSQEVKKTETNTIFGILGCQVSGSCLSAPELAKAITTNGRIYLTKLIHTLEGVEFGSEPDNNVFLADTDGLFLHTTHSREEIQKILNDFKGSDVGLNPEIKEEYESVLTFRDKLWCGLKKTKTGVEYVNKGVFTKSHSILSRELAKKLSTHLLTDPDASFDDLFKTIKTTINMFEDVDCLVCKETVEMGIHVIMKSSLKKMMDKSQEVCKEFLSYKWKGMEPTYVKRKLDDLSMIFDRWARSNKFL